MSRSSILYALWCIGVIALMMVATINGFSPFASGGSRSFFFASQRGSGPTHK